MTSLRYALRSLARSKLFVVISMVALGTGLGLSTTMFSVMDAIVNPAMPYRDPDALFHVNPWFGRGAEISHQQIYRFVRERSHSFDAVVPQSFSQMVLEDGNRVERHGVLIAGPEWFELAGMRIRRGRAFTRADRDDVMLVTEEAWTQLFNRRRDLVGSAIMLGGRSRTVVGLIPRGSQQSYFAIPLGHIDSVGSIGVRPLVRLKAGVTREAADDDLKVIAMTLSRAFGRFDDPFALNLIPTVQRREEIRDIHKAMVGAALAVLVIACVNLAHLMLARGLAKRRELALRMALGASRSRVVMQMFLECVLITAGGAVIGALIAIWGAWLLKHHTPSEVNWIGAMRPQLSWRVFAASAAAAACSAILFGLIPAIRVATGISLDDPLKDDAGTTTARTKQRYSPLVAAEVGLALVLMMGGALLLRTIWTLHRTETLAFNARDLYRVQIGMRPDTTSTPLLAPHEVLAAAAAVPGVLGVAWRGTQPASGNAIFAEQTGDTSRFINVTAAAVSPEYLRVLGLPVINGRDFGPGDEAGNGVAIIDPVAAQRLYPGVDPIGHMIKLGGPGSEAPWVPIVGVMRSPWILEASERLAEQRGNVFVTRLPAYRPPRVVNGRVIVNFSQMSLLARTVDKRAATALNGRLYQLAGVQYAGVWAYDYQREAELASRGFLANVFVVIGAVALGLAILGLYGVLAYAVNRRMREFAIRLALGAEPRGLRRMVLHDGFVMLLAGIGAGAFVALVASRWLDAVLISVLPSDVVSLVACEVVLLAAGLAAALAPAHRAARANPLEILRAS